MKILRDPRDRLVFGSGVVAMLVAVGAALLVRIVSGSPTLPELVGDNLVVLIPGDLFELGIRLLGPLAKKLLFVVLNLGLILVGGGLALALRRLDLVGPRTLDQALRSALRSIVAALLVTAALTALLGGPGTLDPGLGMLVLIAIAYGVVLTAARWRQSRPVIKSGQSPSRTHWYVSGPTLSRRAVLSAGATVAGVTAIAVARGTSFAPAPAAGPTGDGTTPSSAKPAGAIPTAVAPTPVARSAQPPAVTPTAPAIATVGAASATTTTSAAAEPPSTAGSPTAAARPASPAAATSPSQGGFTLAIPAGAEAEVTPTGEFYKVSKNFFADPRVDARQWQLRVDGLVEKATNYRLADLQGMPSLEKQHTLTCISNDVGGKLISNAAWKGVRLADVLRQVGVKPGVRKIVLYGADGYTDSIPLERGMDPGALLAYEMNGATLPPEHGFPLRLLVPNIYGMKNVKWITRIELVSTDYQGYWQRGGWSDPANIKTMSRIDVARGRGSGQPVSLAGIAFAGERGVRAVEISADGGKTWRGAQVKTLDAPNVWTLWVAEWVPESRGSFRVMVRAVDGAGEVQTASVAPSFPDGASGLHSVSVSV